MRVISWNLRNRGEMAAERLGDYLAHLDPAPDIILLQEVNLRAVGCLRNAARLDWLEASIEATSPETKPGRRLGVAIGARGIPLLRLLSPVTTDLPERTLVAVATIDGKEVTLAAYHAPPGVSWKLIKPRQAVQFTEWLVDQPGPVLLGADANTPVIDAPDFVDTRTHWHTGKRILQGEVGDDVLFGPSKLHHLDDALRRWLDDHPDEQARIAKDRPSGPLAVSLQTGGRGRQRAFDRRYDAVWITPEFRVTAVNYPYAESVAVGSDHSAVVVDLEWVQPPAG